ncbi:MAG: DUF898 family protein [Caulobacterales bacterium]
MSLDDAESHPFTQTARFGELLRLAVRNAGLSIVTLTLYRFWARTSMRRRIWARTNLMGDPMEYEGTGWELFRGFLISLPTFFLPAIFVIYLAPLAFEPAIAGLMLLVFYACAIPLINAARYWMRRYQLSRTRWRGIRLGLDGSAWAFAWASTGWSLLEFITFGWYGPAARMRRAQMMWENTRFGDQPFSFGKNNSDLADGLYGKYALGWIVGPIVFFLLCVAGFAAIGFASVSGALGEVTPGAPSPLFIGLGVAVFAIALLLSLLLWLPYNAAAMNRTAELLELDGARFKLKVKSLPLLGVTLASALVFIFSIGLLAPLSGAIYMRFVLNRLEMIGQPRFAEIAQNINPRTSSGEGLADAFDLDFGIGLV